MKPRLAMIALLTAGCAARAQVVKIHQVPDISRAAAFYRGLGLTPQNSTTFSIPGETFTVELIQSKRPSAFAGMQTAGATRLVLSVRNIDASLATARSLGAPIMTPGAEPIAFPTPPGVTRGISIRDPGGYIVELVQFDPPAATTAPGNSPVAGGRISTTAADLEKTAAFYRTLGFEITSLTEFRASENVMKMFDIPATRWRYAMANLPGSSTQWELAEFQTDRRLFLPRYEDDAPAFVITIPNRPRAGAMRDPDGVLLKLIERK